MSGELLISKFHLNNFIILENFINFALFIMNPFKIAGFSIIALVWIWLCWSLLALGGINIRNIFLVLVSGIVIFVPLWKKYFRQDKK